MTFVDTKWKYEKLVAIDRIPQIKQNLVINSTFLFCAGGQRNVQRCIMQVSIYWFAH